MKPKTFLTIIKYLCIFILGVIISHQIQFFKTPYLIDSIWFVICLCNFELDS